jgi:hypothetical protein
MRVVKCEIRRKSLSKVTLLKVDDIALACSKRSSALSFNMGGMAEGEKGELAALRKSVKHREEFTIPQLQSLLHAEQQLLESERSRLASLQQHSTSPSPSPPAASTWSSTFPTPDPFEDTASSWSSSNSPRKSNPFVSDNNFSSSQRNPDRANDADATPSSTSHNRYASSSTNCAHPAPQNLHANDHGTTAAENSHAHRRKGSDSAETRADVNKQQSPDAHEFQQSEKQQQQHRQPSNSPSEAAADDSRSKEKIAREVKQQLLESLRQFLPEHHRLRKGLEKRLPTWEQKRAAPHELCNRYCNQDCVAQSIKGFLCAFKEKTESDDPSKLRKLLVRLQARYHPDKQQQHNVEHRRAAAAEAACQCATELQNLLQEMQFVNLVAQLTERGNKSIRLNRVRLSDPLRSIKERAADEEGDSSIHKLRMMVDNRSLVDEAKSLEEECIEDCSVIRLLR